MVESTCFICLENAVTWWLAVSLSWYSHCNNDLEREKKYHSVFLGHLDSNPCISGFKEKTSTFNFNPSVTLIILLHEKNYFGFFWLNCSQVLSKLLSTALRYWENRNTEVLSSVSDVKCCLWSAHKWHLSALLSWFCGFVTELHFCIEFCL